MKDDEWERTGRQKYNDPTQRLSFVDIPDKIAKNADKEELTQADAEKLYEEIMSK